jgi:hypothetical protein
MDQNIYDASIAVGAPNLYGDPVPFDIETSINEYNKTEPTEKISENRSAITSALSHVTEPFINQGYTVASSLNRGLASFAQHLDNISKYVEVSTGMKSEGLFENMAKVYSENADYWKKRADENGANFVDELVGEAVGGFVPGVAQFSLDVSSGLTFSYMDGAYEGYKKGESPFINGMVEAGKTGALKYIFSAINPLKQYLRAPIMGTVFGTQGAMEAPEGQKAKEFVKGMAIGAGYSLTSPGGRMGLNEVAKNIEPEIQSFVKKMQEERGSIDLTKKEESKPQERQRAFLQTTAESQKIDPTVKEKVEAIEPQTYTQISNVESQAQAQKRVMDNPDEAEIFVRSDTPLTAEKGQIFHELIKKNQNERNFDKAVELIEEFDRQGRAAGQFIQTAAQWSKLLSPEGFIKWANKQLDKTKNKYSWADTILKRKPEDFKLGKDEEKTVLEKYREISQMDNELDRADSTLQLIDMVAKKVPPSVSELIDAYRYQNMLSSPKTQLRNMNENLFNTFITNPIDITTKGAIDYVLSGVTGKERESYVKDVPVYMKATINSIPNAIMAFKETMKLGRNATLEKPELGIEAKSAFETARSRQIPSYLTVVSRFMEAQDKFNMALIGSGQMAIDLKNGMTELEAYSHGKEISEKLLYRSEIDPKNPDYSIPSKLLADLTKMIEWTRNAPVLKYPSKWYVPFLRTPMNKAIQMIERSPAGLIRTNMTMDSASKLLGGAIVSGLGATMAYLGETTWSAPTDETSKQLFYASGRKPFSVKMGEKWVPIWYLGPFALAFGIPAAFKYYTQDAKSSMTDGATEKIFNISEGLAQFVGSQSSTQSIGALFSALDGDIDYKLSNQTGFAITQMVPLSSFVRYVNTIVDPVYRHPQGFIEGIESNLPVLSKTLEPYYTPLMEESKRDTVNYFLPYDTGKVTEPYESLFYLQQMQSQQTYKQNKMNKLIEKMKAKPENIDKHLNEYMKISTGETK